MMSLNSTHVVSGLMSLLLAVTGDYDVKTADVITLTSPRPKGNAWFGFSVASAGDVNQDGLADLIVGAYAEGRAYVFSGRDLSPLFELRSPHRWGGFGWHVAGAGDVDQDGFADLIVGAPFDEPGTSPEDAGRAYVFSGRDAHLIREIVSPNQRSDGNFGNSVGGAVDVNQDGFADVIVGAPDEDPGTSPRGAGRAYVFSGADGSLLLELMSPHEEPGGRFGWSVAGVGDVNQDGRGDILVGAVFEDPGNIPFNVGLAFVLSGQDGSLLFELASPNEEPNGQFGHAVASAGDVNQDGISDLLVGAEMEDGGAGHAGRAYTFSGLDGSLLFELVSPHAENNGFFGSAVAGAGDVDRDGFADVIVGAPFEGDSRGRAYIFSGQDASLLVELVSPAQKDSGYFGSSVATMGDFNDDGFADVIAGAFGEDAGNRESAGLAHVFLSPFASRINGGGPKKALVKTF